MTADSPVKSDSPQLPTSLDYAEIRIRSSAKLFGQEPDDDPGLLRVSATVSIPDFPYDHLSSDEAPPLSEIEGIGLATAPMDGGGTEITILRAEGLVLDLYRISNPFETLDADSEELVAYACLFDLEGGNGLDPELEHRIMGPGIGRVVIVERVRIAPAWRGCGGIGRYLASRLLPLVCPDAAVVATQPFPIDAPRNDAGEVDKSIFDPGLKQVQHTWKSIGFEPYKNDIWIMDPSSNKHERAVAKLEKKLGLSADRYS
jgi:hypothetical protein